MIRHFRFFSFFKFAVYFTFVFRLCAEHPKIFTWVGTPCSCVQLPDFVLGGMHSWDAFYNFLHRGKTQMQ